ncbi:hypothetical protein FACS189413_04580 [Bacteroidia bacterium]|nr:hypothetical protein FACS189413_04580 [Bacteroidia bacterium]
METIDNQYKGETLNFPQLLKNHKVEIPIIQRDYAQGREDKKEIRNNFLNALYQSIKCNKEIKLDFIYGSTVDDSFQPLDGQQRLTTLFLLYWYACTKDNYLDNTNIELLHNFTYETRISSRDFCKRLISNPITINGNEAKLSNQIINASWFYLSWKNDPTIDAMLRTIDGIHSLFYSVDDLWNRLMSDENLISFYYVELENIGLTDDLYIKMNARGKLLSFFENFKASFQKYINDKKWEESKNQTDLFAFKIDTIWTDYFWNNFKKNNSIDEALIRFISTVAMIRQSLDKLEDRINTITKLQENPNLVRPELFTEDGFKYLVNCFEIYNKVLSEKINVNLTYPLWRHTPKNSILSEIVFGDNIASYTQKVLFYAQTEYLLRISEFNKENFNDWMRVVRNIVSRGYIERSGKRPDIIRSPQTFDGIINLISELSEGCDNIYLYLSTKDKLTSQFAKEQVDEEKIKAKLITKDINNKQIIFDTEDNDLLMGRIEFALYCSDFNDIDNFNVSLFNNVQKVVTKYFNKETSSVTNELRRALLTIEVDGLYAYYNYWWSYWYVGDAHKRCLLDTFRELEYYIYSDYREYLKKIIIQLIDNELSNIITNFVPPLEMPNWKKRLIQEPDLLDKKSKSNYIAIPENESCCHLLKSKRPRDLDGCYTVE